MKKLVQVPSPRKRGEGGRRPDEGPLDKIRDIVAALPETSEKLSHGSPTFWARKRTFLSFVDNHHGDGRLAVWCAASKDEQETLVAADSKNFFVPPYVGPSGWIGIRLDRGLDWKVIASLIAEGHRFVLAKQGRRRSSV
jgi:hypothetical protein